MLFMKRSPTYRAPAHYLLPSCIIIIIQHIISTDTKFDSATIPFEENSMLCKLPSCWKDLVKIAQLTAFNLAWVCSVREYFPFGSSACFKHHTQRSLVLCESVTNRPRLRQPVALEQ